jgi:hypothetical protein
MSKGHTDFIMSNTMIKLRPADNVIKLYYFLFKWVLDRGPEQSESKMTVLCPPIIIILIS